MISLMAAALIAQAQGAAPSASAPLAAPKPAVAGGDKVMCKTLPQTGSLFGGPKECHTKDQWNAINAASRDNVGDFQQRSHQMGGPH